MLELPNGTVTGKRLAVNGPAYKALIIDSEQGPPTDPVKTAMPVAAARKILSYARAGLPVVIVGDPPNRTPGNSPEADGALRSVIGQLLAERSVSRVEHEADVPAKLRSIGIRPAADPSQPASLLSIRRRDAETRTDYYFFYNQGIVSPPDEPATLFEPATGQPVDREVSLEGRGRPYALDTWSGKIVPVAQYTTSGDRVTLRVRLSRDNAVLIALAEDPDRFGSRAPAAHVIRTDADGASIEGDRIFIRAPRAGAYSTTLGNGRTVRTAVASVAAPINLTNRPWHLVVEDWQPANPYATSVGKTAAETRKTRIELDLNELKPWPAIQELRHVSGLGTYIANFDLPSDWSAANGAKLSLGEVFDSFTVKVNGQPAPVDQISAEADITPWLKPGQNTVEVRVATILNNRLASLDEDVANRGLVQPYGLVGPVVVTPYGRAAVWAAGK